jgi:hypothetical protein
MKKNTIAPFISSEEYSSRLDHYNKWLMDNKRKFDEPYKGYPERKKNASKKATKGSA